MPQVLAASAELRDQTTREGKEGEDQGRENSGQKGSSWTPYYEPSAPAFSRLGALLGNEERQDGRAGMAARLDTVEATAESIGVGVAALEHVLDEDWRTELAEELVGQVREPKIARKQGCFVRGYDSLAVHHLDTMHYRWRCHHKQLPCADDNQGPSSLVLYRARARLCRCPRSAYRVV